MGLSCHAIRQSLTAMQAQTGRTLSDRMPVHSVLLYPPDTPRNQLPPGVTVRSGGSETTGQDRMQIVKSGESGFIARCMKSIWVF